MKKITKKELVYVSFMMAEELLENNSYNKKMGHSFHDEKVEYIKSMIRNSKWETDESKYIEITEDGKLINGQHRLKAIADLKTTLPIWIHTISYYKE